RKGDGRSVPLRLFETFTFFIDRRIFAMNEVDALLSGRRSTPAPDAASAAANPEPESVPAESVPAAIDPFAVADESVAELGAETPESDPVRTDTDPPGAPGRSSDGLAASHGGGGSTPPDTSVSKAELERAARELADEKALHAATQRQLNEV